MPQTKRITTDDNAESLAEEFYSKYLKGHSYYPSKEIKKDNELHYESDRDYKLNYNPHILKHEKIDPHTLQIVQKLSELTDTPSTQYVQEEIINSKKVSKFLEIIKNKLLRNNNINVKPTAIKNNIMHFFKVNMNQITEDTSMLKKDDEKILVGGEPLMKSQINLIAQKILGTCNYSHSKNKNNSRTLKVGEGKLMFTNGMSLSEFEKKYNL